MTTIHEIDQLTALIDCNNDLRRELDAANKLIRELYDENDKLLKRILNSQHKEREL